MIGQAAWHDKGMRSTHACQSCHEQPAETVNCKQCACMAHQMLTEIRRAYPMLTLMLNPQVQPNKTPVGAHAKPWQPSTPLNLTVFDLLYGLEDEGGINQTMLHMGRDMGLPPTLPAEQMLHALTTLDLTNQPAVAWYMPRLHEILRHVKKILGVGKSKHVQYQCPHCLKPLTLENSQAHTACTRCGTISTRRQLQEHLMSRYNMAHPHAAALSAAKASQLISELTGEHIPETTIRTWAAKQQISVNSDGETRQYEIMSIWQHYTASRAG